MTSAWETMRAVINALLPRGGIWKPAPAVVEVGRDLFTKEDGGLDLFLDGMSLNHEDVRLFLSNLANIRNPFLTTFLEDLEKEFGISPNTVLSESDRRDILAVKKYVLPGTGSAQQLEDKLTAAGFDLTVRQNNPPIDPDLWLANVYQCIANTTTAVAGNDAAFAGVTGGELVVNGDQYEQSIDYIAQANGPTTVAGNDEAVAGYFTDITQTLITYSIPDEPSRWPYIFYVGGRVAVWADPPTFDRGEVPNEKKDLLKTIILQHKPLHSWCGLVVDYI